MSVQYKKDVWASIVLAVLYCGLAVATWERWTNPLIDHGRELNIPARLLEGDRLYVDLLYYYGPLAPNLNAFLYRIFGVHLSVLHTAGFVAGALISALIYLIARTLLNPPESALATSLTIVTGAANTYQGTFMLPYSYAALYGMVFALASLAATIGYVTRRSWKDCAAAGLAAGLTLITKPEYFMMAVAPLLALLALHSISCRRWFWKEGLWLLVPAGVVCFVTCAVFYAEVPWLQSIREAAAIMNSPPFARFSRRLSGLNHVYHNVGLVLGGVGWALLCASLLAFPASAVPLPDRRMKRRNLARAGAMAVTSLLLVIVFDPRGRLWDDGGPVTGTPLLLVTVLAASLFRGVRQAMAGTVNPRNAKILVLAIFAQLATMRSWLLIALKGPYAPFIIPVAGILWCVVLFRAAAAFLTTEGPNRNLFRAAGVTAGTLAILWLAAWNVLQIRDTNTFVLESKRGRMLVAPQLGEPFAAAVEWTIQRTKPGEYVVSVPNANMINFLTARRNPLSEEGIVPGLLTPEREEADLRRLRNHPPALVLINHSESEEFRRGRFGIAYNTAMYGWIQDNYRLAASFRSASPENTIDAYVPIKRSFPRVP